MATTVDQFENHKHSASRNGFADMHEALAWAIQTFDAKFQGNEFVQLHIEQYMTSGPLPDDEFVHVWSASVSGSIENKVDRAESA